MEKFEMMSVKAKNVFNLVKMAPEGFVYSFCRLIKDEQIAKEIAWLVGYNGEDRHELADAILAYTKEAREARDNEIKRKRAIAQEKQWAIEDEIAEMMQAEVV